jgi:hypothetical protein
MRLFLPGQAVGNWRNSVIRENRLTPVKAKVLGRLTGGRLLDARGYYFHEGGRTWLSESFTADVKGTPRTLTRISSLAFPKREHFFDRPLTLGNGAAGKGDTSPIGDDYHPRELPMQSVVDVVKGEKQPSQVPGYIGSTSEVENITGIAGLKRALFAASWFLVDESERDVGGGLAAFDYPAEGGGDYSRYRRVDKNRTPIRSAASYPEDSLLFYNPRTQAVTATPSGGSVAIPVRTSSGETPRAVPVRVVGSSGDKAEQAPVGARYFKEKLPYEYLEEVIEDRIPDEKGIERPMLLRGFKQTPLDLAGDSPGTPDAIYHDGERWRQVTDDKDLKDLSRAYQNKDLKVTKNWQEFTAGYPAV